MDKEIVIETNDSDENKSENTNENNKIESLTITVENDDESDNDSLEDNEEEIVEVNEEVQLESDEEEQPSELFDENDSISDKEQEVQISMLQYDDEMELFKEDICDNSDNEVTISENDNQKGNTENNITDIGNEADVENLKSPEICDKKSVNNESSFVSRSGQKTVNLSSVVKSKTQSTTKEDPKKIADTKISKDSVDLPLNNAKVIDSSKSSNATKQVNAKIKAQTVKKSSKESSKKSMLVNSDKPNDVSDNKTEPKSVVVPIEKTKDTDLHTDQLSIGGSSSDSCDELDEELRRKSIDSKVSTKKTVLSKNKPQRNSPSLSPVNRRRHSSHDKNSRYGRERSRDRRDRFSRRSPLRSRSPIRRSRRSPSPLQRNRRSISPVRRERKAQRNSRYSVSPQKYRNSTRRRRSSQSISPKRYRKSKSPSRKSRSPLKQDRYYKKTENISRRRSYTPSPDRSKKRKERSSSNSRKNTSGKDATSPARSKARHSSHANLSCSTKENTNTLKQISEPDKKTRIISENEKSKTTIGKDDARNLIRKKPVVLSPEKIEEPVKTEQKQNKKGE